MSNHNSQVQPPTECKIDQFYKPHKTEARNYITKTGISKNEEWLQIEGCPCKVISINDNNITLNSLSASSDRNFVISKKELYNGFDMCPVVDSYITKLDKYPEEKILVSEFIKKDEVKLFKKKIDKCLQNSKNILMRKILGDKFDQMSASQGGGGITISMYHKFINVLTFKSPLTHFGDPIFNRNSRWAPPIDITFEEFKKSPSYPAPMGIRRKDFCLPSELIETMEELIRQIMAFDNIDSSCLETIITKKSDKKHKCLWCGEIINACDYNSNYGSKDNFIEICHRDPNQRFISTNMYWGHGECNRRQGGYSEEDRIEDALRLLKNNPCYVEKYKLVNPFN